MLVLVLVLARLSATPFLEHAFSVFSGNPKHDSSSAILAAVSCALSGRRLRLDELPEADGLSDGTLQCLHDELLACGFRESDGVLSIHDQEHLQQLLTEKNAARRRAHSLAAASREALLSAQVHMASTATHLPDLDGARNGILAFVSRFDGQPAMGPLLGGVAQLLRAQAAAPSLWRVGYEPLLNGGDEMCASFVALLPLLGLEPRFARDAERGGDADAELVIEVRSGTWTRAELLGLASLVESRCRRQPIRGLASGSVKASAHDSALRVVAGWPEWLQAFWAAGWLRATTMVGL